MFYQNIKILKTRGRQKYIEDQAKLGQTNGYYNLTLSATQRTYPIHPGGLIVQTV